MEQEAALFKRHWKEVESRLKALRAKEDVERQSAFLDAAYKGRLLQEDNEAAWDPVEDVVEDERGRYVDLIKHFIWQSVTTNDLYSRSRLGTSETDKENILSGDSQKSKERDEA